jgi:hypothetical protein
MESGAKPVEYNNTKTLTLGNFKFFHGFMFSEQAVRDHAEAFGNCVFAHTHRIGVAKGRRSDNPTGVCVGTLTTIPAMRYAKTNRSRLDYDGQADIVWHKPEPSLGFSYNYAWWMNGVIFTGSTLNFGNSTPSTWRLLSTGDMDRDGYADLIFRNTSTAQMAYWYMTNSYKSSVVLATAGDLNWYVVGTGDFNADGITDLLWHQHIDEHGLLVHGQPDWHQLSWRRESPLDSRYKLEGGNHRRFQQRQ